MILVCCAVHLVHDNGGGSVPKSCITVDKLLVSTTDSILPLQ